MNEENTKKIYQKKIRLIQKYNKYYYDQDAPIVIDREYDLKKRDSRARK